MGQPRAGCGVRRLVTAFFCWDDLSSQPHRRDACVIAVTLSPCAKLRMLSGLCLSDKSLRQ